MKNIFIVIVFGFLNLQVNSQNLQVFSALDSSYIPNASLMATSNGENWYFVASDMGIVDLSTLPRNKEYFLQVSSIGFLTDTLTTLLQPNTRIYLQAVNLALDGVVITGQASPVNAAESVYDIAIITKTQIEQLGATNLKDILVHQPGIRISEDMVLGTTIEINGLSGEHIKILINGIPMIGRQDGNLDISQINMADVERIEIIEGPMSVKFGTNAIGGVINIITKTTSPNKFSAAVNSYYETTGEYNNEIYVQAKTGNRSSIGLNAFRNYFDGWEMDESFHVLPVSTLADTNRVQAWKPRMQYEAGGFYRVNFQRVMLLYTTTIFNEKITNRGFPRSPYYETAFDEYYLTTRFDNVLQVSTTWKFIDWVNEISSNNYNRIKNTYLKSLVTLEEDLVPTADSQDTSVFNLWHLKSTVMSNNSQQKISYEIGVEANRETAEGKRIDNNFQKIDEIALFTSLKYQPVKYLQISPALRYGYNSQYKQPLIPSFHIKYSQRDFSLRSSVACGFRSPTLKEQYFYFVDINHNIIGNQELTSESAVHISVAPSYHIDATKLDWQFSATIFYNNIHNLISLALINDDTYSYVNIGEYSTRGVNTEIKLISNQLQIFTGFNITGESNGESFNNDQILFTPSSTIGVLWKARSIPFTASLNHSYKGIQQYYFYDANETLQLGKLESYQIMDVIFHQKIFNNTVEIGLGVKNILNVSYLNSATSGSVHNAGNAATPISTGRSLFVKLKYEFKWK